MGDFYEMYGEDAKKAAPILDLHLASRSIPGAGRVEMCGIPSHALNRYVKELRHHFSVTVSSGNWEKQERTTITHPAYFQFGGYHFEAIGNLPAGYDLDHLMKHEIASDPELGFSTYEGAKVAYSHKDFYDASGDSKADVFRCADNGKLYLPGENTLFLYSGEYRELELLPEPAPKEPTIQSVYKQNYPAVRDAVLADVAYRNACINSDEQNARIECNAAISSAINTGDWDMNFRKLYYDSGIYHDKLHREIWEETYPILKQQRENQQTVARYDPKRFSVRAVPDTEDELAIWDAAQDSFYTEGGRIIRFHSQESADNYLSGLQNVDGIPPGGTLENVVFLSPGGKEYRIGDTFNSNLLLILCIAMLTACAPNPTQDFVTSKNDGAFESNIQETAPQQSSDETSLTRTSSFESTDGSVEYVWNIDQTIIDGPMPVVEAVPYFFTTEDARQVATVLFGDAVFYDIGPETKRHYSRGELERKINLLSRYADEDTLYELIGPYVIHSDLQKLLRSYNQQLETAPSDDPRSICDWTFKKESYYEDDGKYGMGDGTNDQLNIATTIDNHSYYIAVDVRNKSDYQTSTISVTLGDGSSYVERELQLVELCMTEMPTQEQIDSATAEAQRSLDQMGLGEFVVAKASVSVIEAGSVPGYAIVVNAVPIIEGVPGLVGHTGIHLFTIEDITDDSTIIRGRISCVYNEDGSLSKINNSLVYHSFHGQETIISENEAFEKLCRGEFNDETGSLENASEVTVTSCTLEYQVDTKGYYQPVFIFEVTTDVNDESLAVIIPALG